MKKIFVLLFAGAVLSALCAFAIVKSTNMAPMPTTEDQCCHSGLKWVCVSDDCGKCVINDTERKCGKCGGYMKSGKDKVDGEYVKCTYTCKKCGHSCVYKCK